MTQNLIPEVAAASDEALVSALVVLTHQSHASKHDREKPLARIRLERDLVRAEVLRRMGGVR